jgi:predicted transcriptional regulator
MGRKGVFLKDILLRGDRIYNKTMKKFEIVKKIFEDHGKTEMTTVELSEILKMTRPKTYEFLQEIFEIGKLKKFKVYHAKIYWEIVEEKHAKV